MINSYHSVPRPLFDALAVGGGGPDAVAELARAQYSKNLLLLLGVLRVRTGQPERARDGYDLLAQVQRHDRAAAAAVITHPAVGAWSQQVIRQAGNRSAMAATADSLCAVAAAAAIRAGMSAEIEVPVTDGLAMLPSLGAAVADGVHVRVKVDETGTIVVGRVRIPDDPHQEAPGWYPMRQFGFGQHALLIDDLDPYRMPASNALTSRLNAAEAARWTADIALAWPLLRDHHEDAAAEIAEIVRVIVPHFTPTSGYSSSSTAETYGAVALSAPIDPIRTAEILIHETQHIKLFALLDIVTVLLPDDGRRYYAPWRPDPRPLDGLLQGAYAFLGVSGFWRLQRFVAGQDGDAVARAHTEYAKWRMATKRVVHTLLASDRLTPAGRDFADGMAHTLASWNGDDIPSWATHAAITEADTHQVRWEKENGRTAD